LQPNRVVSRDRLIDQIWDGAPPDTASTALNVYVSQLRKAFGRDTIVTQPPGYVLKVDADSIDLARFEWLTEKARGQEPAVAAQTLRDALALWRGAPLADLDTSLARVERAQIEELGAAAIEERVEADLALGRHHNLVPELERLVRDEPLRERRQAQLMLALYRSGRQAEALDVYRATRRRLMDELGLDPGEELRRLEKAILEHDPALGDTAEPGTPAVQAVPRGSEQRRLGLIARSRVALAAGAVVLAAALAAAILLAGRDSGASPVAVAANSVAAIDPASGRVVADIPIGGRPVAIAVGANAVWVVNADDATVLRIDPKTYRVVRTIGGLGTNPSNLAVGFGSVWVAGGNDGTLIRIDPRVNAAEGTVRLGAARGGIPQPVFLVATGAGSVWATRGNELLRVDPATNSAVARASVDRPVGLGAGAGSAWVAQENEQLLRVTGRSMRITRDADFPQQINFPLVAGGSLWLVVYTEHAQVWRVDPATLAQSAAVPLSLSFAFGLASGAGAIWTADHVSGVVWRIDPSSQQVRPLATVGHHPIAIAAGDGAVWVGVQERPFS
jgi:DNA-binding SARP family transcriptional activator